MGSKDSPTVDEEVFDSPRGWVARHISQYVETNGRKGHRWQGVPTLLLTTRGRKTGKLRRTALIYGVDGDRYVVVASTGGAAQNPAWYLNLVDDPEVGLQVGAATFRAEARTADRDEKPPLWELMASIWPDYDKYQAKTTREIPVIVLDRI
jgi:deazaflavin-dependent oxidoreductase (nitroreductase family)